MKIILTGCAGFIGSHLSEKLLSDGNTIIGIDNFDDFYPRAIKEQNLKNQLSSSLFTLLEKDLCNKDTFNALPKDIDIVIHLAAKAGVRPSISNPVGYINNNIIATQNLLKWMEENNINKFIFASSSSVYGNNLKVPFSENDVADKPISPYAFTKRSCELLNYTYHQLYGISIINLRLFTVYGPRQRPDLAIRKFVELIKNNNPVTIYGDGNTGRDYTYVDDIVRGISGAIEYLKKNNNVFETINLGNSEPVSLSQLIDTIYELLGKEKNIIHTSMQQGDVNYTYSDIQKAGQLLNYRPETALKTGLKNFINWYEKYD